VDHPAERQETIKRRGIHSVAVIPAIAGPAARGILCIAYRRHVQPNAELDRVCQSLATLVSDVLAADDEWHSTHRTIAQLRGAANKTSSRETTLARGLAFERQLVNRAASGFDVDELLQSLAAQVDGHAVLADRFGRAVGSVGCTAEEAADLARVARARKRHPVTLAGEVVGYLAVRAASLDESLRAKLVSFSSAMSVALSRRRTIAMTELGLSRNIVDALIDGRTPDAIASDAHLLGLDLSVAHRVAVIRAKHNESLSFTSDVRRRIDVILAEISASGESTLSATWRGDDLVLVVPARDAAAARKILDHVTKRLASDRIARRLPVTIGAGGACDSIVEFPRSYREARIVLESQTDQASSAVVFEELGVEWLIGQVPVDRLKAFQERMLGELRSYDVAHGSHLIESLRVFLDAQSDAVASAHRMQIHPNTMRYRLQRIRDITGFELSRPEVRLGLEVALRAVPP
jgi:sugar diacid utilization regulator